MALNAYNQKRNFSKTSEPKGAKTRAKGQKRFVIQYHEARAKHYDFRLEYNGVLLSWAVPKGLPQKQNVKRLAVMVEDHPLEYITFEGTIPKGEYGAGTVEQFDYGTYVPINSFKSGLKQGKLKFYLQGNKHEGVWALIKKDDKNWFIFKCNDQGISKSQKNARLPFTSCNVQLAKLASKIPQGKNWLFEIKYDGYRTVAYINGGKTKLVSRNGKDFTNKFKSVTNSLNAHFSLKTAVLDGEVVVFDNSGKSNFSLLQTGIKSKENNFCYVVFDILALGEQDLRPLPLLSRKNTLKALLQNAPANLIYSQHVQNKGKECFKIAKQKQLEGIVAKDANSAYAGTRNNDWLKIKCYKRQEFVICGYTTTQKNQALSAIIVGYYQNSQLVFAGKVGTGFNDQMRDELSKKFKKLLSKTKTVNKAPKNTIFLKPKLVAEVQFAEFTAHGVLRQPSFVGLREDKNAKDVIKEVAYDN